MMWDKVMERVRTMILTDATLILLVGDAFRKAGPNDLVVPLIEWTLLGDTENELWAPMLVQFDCWAKTADDARKIERRLRVMFHQPVMMTLGDIKIFSEYSDGADLATPNRANFTGRAIRFRFSPLRQQYARPA